MKEQEKKKILVIDDQEEIRDLVIITLHGTEFQVMGAEDWREGIRCAREYKPDLILLDIMMPGFDGFTTCKIIKRNPSTKDTPVIFLTAKKTKDDIAKALKAGGSDYIVKPFSPSELLTRIRKIVNTQDAKNTQGERKEESPEKLDQSISYETIMTNFVRFKDIIVCSEILKSISIDNLHIYRDIFSNIVSDGIFKIVVNMTAVRSIDGAGLALLLSVHESLKSYGGGLVLTLVEKSANNRFSFAQLTDLFTVRTTLDEAMDVWNSNAAPAESQSNVNDLNICMTCSYANEEKARFCSFCGTNLVLGRGKDILDSIRRSIIRRVFSDAQTNDVEKLNKNRISETEKTKIPSEFIVEIFADNLSIILKSSHTYTKGFKDKNLIAIEAPVINGQVLPILPGMKVNLKTSNTGDAVVETAIEGVVESKGAIIVRYTKEAGIIHAKKNFSIAPAQPIPVNLINPLFQNTAGILKARILELSRVRMIVFAEEKIPEDKCLAVSFELPDGALISSPLVLAKRRKDLCMYDVDFIIMDEKEQSRMIQYMFRRQIEMARVENI